MALEPFERDDFQARGLAGFEANRWGHSILISLQPAGRAHTPVIPRLESGKSVLGSRCPQIIPLGKAVCKEPLAHHATHGVATQIGPIGATGAIPEPTGQGFTTTEDQRFSKNVQGLWGAGI